MLDLVSRLAIGKGIPSTAVGGGCNSLRDPANLANVEAVACSRGAFGLTSKNMKKFLLAVFATALAAPVTGQVVALWHDDDTAHQLVSISYNDALGVLALDRTPNPETSVTLNLGKVTSVDRIDLGVDHDLILLCGDSSVSGTGFVVAITETGGVFSSLSTLWVGSGTPVGIGYSAQNGELYFFDNASDSLYWATFAPASVSVSAWSSIAINTAPLGSIESIEMGVLDAPSPEQVLAVLVSDNIQASRMEIILDGAGLVSSASLTPLGGSDFGIFGPVIIEDNVVNGYGPPGSVLEVFNEDTGQLLSAGIADSEGVAAMVVPGLSLGDRIGVRELVTGQGSGSLRAAFSVIGSGVPGPSGIIAYPFGDNSAGTLVAGNMDFRLFCQAEAPLTAPGWYPGLAVFGLPSNVIYSPSLGWLMIGAEVVTFPSGMTRKGEYVSGHADVPIPVNLLGLDLCLQWLSFDNNVVVSSNIACMRVLPAF